MDLYEGMLALVLFIALLVSTQQFIDHQRTKTKERRKRCLTDAEMNVRITDQITGIEIRPISILDQGGETFDFDAETVRGPREQKTFLDVSESDFKHSVKDTIRTGKVHYRLFRSELKETPRSEAHPVYTDEELEKISNTAFIDKTEMEGELLRLKAEREESVDTIIEHGKDMVGNRWNPGGAK